MDYADLMWLAGYLEGEGCFRINGIGKSKSRPKSAGTPTIKVGATDLDVVSRTASLMGCACREAGRPTVTGTRVYVAQIHGEQALSLMAALLPHMGERRKRRIVEVMEVSANRPGRAARGSEKPNSKLTDEDVVTVRSLAKAGTPQVQIARRFNISQAAISLVLTGRTYRHVPNTLTAA